MTNEEIKRRFENVKKAHDELKESPYWINFDNRFLPDVLKKFGEICRNYWGIADVTNPYYAIIRCVTHDFNCMLGNISNSIILGEFNNRWKEHMGDVIMVFQIYLMNIHRIIDHNDYEGAVVGYTYTRSGGIKKFQAFKKDDGTYVVYNVISKNELPNVRKTIEKYINLHDCPRKKWAQDAMKDIEEGHDVIGETWILKVE
jgi:hypothetical protein